VRRERAPLLRVAAVVRAGITVVAAHRRARADSLHARVALRARAPVAARSPRVRRVRASLLRVAAVVRAGIPVVAGQRLARPDAGRASRSEERRAREAAGSRRPRRLRERASLLLGAGGVGTA